MCSGYAAALCAPAELLHKLRGKLLHVLLSTLSARESSQLLPVLWQSCKSCSMSSDKAAAPVALLQRSICCMCSRRADPRTPTKQLLCCLCSWEAAASCAQQELGARRKQQLQVLCSMCSGRPAALFYVHRETSWPVWGARGRESKVNLNPDLQGV